MKNMLLLAFAFCSFQAFSQGTLNYTFTLKSNQGVGMPNVVIRFTNADNGKEILKTTDANGKVNVVLNSENGLTYSISYLDHENDYSITVPEDGERTQSRSLTYVSKAVQDAERPEDRRGVVFKLTTGSGLQQSAKLVVRLADDRMNPIDQPVTIKVVDVAAGLIYSQQRKAGVNYEFNVAPGRTYEIDVDGLACLDKVSVDARSSETTKTVPFVKSNVQETIKGDTVYQPNAANANKSTNRIKYALTLSDFDGNPLEEEPVFLKAMNSNRVYAGKTNAQGKLYFQLPKTDDFIINMKYESNLRKVDCKRSTRGFSEASTSFSNRGYKAIEAERKQAEEERKQAAIAAIERAKEQATAARIAEEMHKQRLEKMKLRDGEKYDPKLFKTVFNSTPIKQHNCSNAKIKKTLHGYSVDLESSSPVGTPVIAGGQVLATSGFYANVLYSFDPVKGKINWGVELAEGGPSALVYENGVVLVYTESCTLYAIDAIAGTLLWSKYLTSYVYSTPSAKNDKVIAVYKDDADSHVAVCMDLRSGSIIWQRPVTSECLGAPVIAGGKTFITCKDGGVNVFDFNTGAVLKRMMIKATSSPTVAGDVMYVSHNLGSNESLAKVDLKTYTYKELNVYNGLQEIAQLGLRENMNHHGSRILGYRGLTYFQNAANLQCLEPQSEKIIWKRPMMNQGIMLQALAIDGMIVAGCGSKVQFFEYKTGSTLMEYDMGGALSAPPAIANNTIYAGTEDGRLITYIIDKKLVGSAPMWGGNAAHNLWME